ncbi:response regulator [Priestia filamentosa]|uniref:Two-component system response regulator n=1 Tax=Priestia filamentosa TaxID=1402861 RepID=A0A1X7D8G5_9BACI|nr:response regulator [Priestia filamentosa]AKO93737.1 two-component system response regulator [Priestia filamentosa]MDT3763974.1 response regulator [Priestia filamentosa]OXS71551.1 two-component system response regulator [Priestia filamentosa]RJS67195.1 two-component system response regulator [Priestia filamentosa]WCM14613.1 response regulator [Priestia filamentosa]
MTKNDVSVLIIEDDPMVQELNKTFINKVQGFTVVGTASNGEEGLEKLKELNPELALLDIFMPKLNGVATLQKLRNENFTTDIIVVSAAKDGETIKKVLQNGAIDYIMKPFTFERLQQALEKYRNYHKRINTESTLSQEQLDSILYSSSKPENFSSLLPKGLNEFTLTVIVDYLKEQREPHSAEEVANGVGIARVTARRYLDYLEKTKAVKIDIQYGGVGRPINRYLYDENRY